MKTFSIQYTLFPLLLALSGSSYWFLQVRSTTLLAHKAQQPSSYMVVDHDHHNMVFIRPANPEQAEPTEKEDKDFQEDRNVLPDVRLLKFILDKSKEGLPVLRLPAFLYR